ncbi:hypothetical protein ASD64_15435 [Mesorhizobium sp. Root157]|uniref:TSUP family transporter n=1 Tax=Mesorhizobium sp. Root157 TaxID=1736477 RepID=UPI0006FADCFC|nr:TSUP family transporter [Mesorhizobium sp. Root157]KQZ99697.1 hypothetical protein ASD64_15435 [Mesorhizobium sp. Root157]
MFEFASETVALLMLAAFAAGFIDSIAGGGALIGIPALLLAGIPPVSALGTNKLQALFGSGSATLAYASKGHVDLRKQLPSAVVAAIGSAIGALAATAVPADMLEAALPVVLIAIALFFAVKPRMNDVDRARRMTPFLFGLTVVPVLGFYDGIFGPGTGSFYMLAFVTLAGHGVLKATAHTKFLNLATNIGALIVFALAGAIYWKIGLVMGVAQFFGARLGALLAIRVGSRLIKPVLVVVCFALTVKLLADPTNPLRATLGI